MSVVTLTLLAMSVVPAADTSGEELKRLQGTWRVVAVARHSEPIDYPTDGDDKTDMVVVKDNITFHTRTGTAGFRINRIKGGEIDLVKKSREGAEYIHVGIYEMRNESLLKICYSEAGFKEGDKPTIRPTEYRSPQDSYQKVIFLERKTEKK